jgi:hypothetical protein
MHTKRICAVYVGVSMLNFLGKFFVSILGIFFTSRIPKNVKKN